MTMPDVQDDQGSTTATPEGAPLEIEFAQASDAEELAALVNAAYRSPSPEKQTTRDADLAHGDGTSVEEMRASMADGMTFLVARDGDRIVACSGHRLLDAETALMEMMAVAPDARLTGVAKLLGRRALIHLATVRGCTQAEIHVFSEHTGMIERYLREGFVVTGETRPVPAELSKVDGLHFVVLRLDLERALRGR